MAILTKKQAKRTLKQNNKKRVITCHNKNILNAQSPNQEWHYGQSPPQTS